MFNGDNGFDCDAFIIGLYSIIESSFSSLFLPLLLPVFCCGKLDSQDGELDAILKELCALGSQFDQELKDEPSTRASTVTSTASLAAPLGN